tara:strand:+ start:593 stop:853 length:261 start_codon:yes stop_codon:yes gene_type:complete
MDTAFANMEINTTENNNVSYPIIVFMDSEKITGPFGEIETQPFLEQFWRETGADCDGEEGDMVFQDGKKYRVILRESIQIDESVPP